MALYVAGETGNKAGRPKGSVKKPSAVVQSRVALVLKKRLTEERINALLDGVSKRDELMFYGSIFPYLFVKPLPPEKPKDELERLDDESLQRLVNKYMEQSKQAYR